MLNLTTLLPSFCQNNGRLKFQIQGFGSFSNKYRSGNITFRGFFSFSYSKVRVVCVLSDLIERSYKKALEFNKNMDKQCDLQCEF